MSKVNTEDMASTIRMIFQETLNWLEEPSSDEAICAIIGEQEGTFTALLRGQYVCTLDRISGWMGHWEEKGYPTIKMEIFSHGRVFLNCPAHDIERHQSLGWRVSTHDRILAEEQKERRRMAKVLLATGQAPHRPFSAPPADLAPGSTSPDFRPTYLAE